MSAAFIARLKQTALPEPDLRSLMGLAQPGKFYEARSNILQETGPASLLLIVEGWAARIKFAADGRRQLPALYVPGDLCNLDNFFASRNSFSVAALTDCVVAVIPMERARGFAGQSATIRDLLWRLMILSNAVSTEWLFSLGRRSTRQRLAHLFLELHARLGSVGMVEKDCFAFPLTQQDLGDISGVSTVHINRAFQSLKRDGLINLKGRRLMILDFDALREIAEFNPDYLHLDF